MDVAVGGGRRRRGRGLKKSAVVARLAHRTALGCLVEAAIKQSEPGRRVRVPVLPAAVPGVGSVVIRPPRFGGAVAVPLPRVGGASVRRGVRRFGPGDSRRSRLRSPVDAFEAHLVDIYRSEQATLEAYGRRIDRLRLLVAEEEGVILDESEDDFWDFVRLHPFVEPGQIVVTSEGHVRLVWKGAGKAHIGIRFSGDRRVRYVIFNRRAGERHLVEMSGEDSFDGVVRQAQASGIPVFRG